MTINSVTNSQYSISQPGRTASAGVASAGAGDVSAASATASVQGSRHHRAHGGGLGNAVMQALSDVLGASDASSTTGSASATSSASSASDSTDGGSDTATDTHAVADALQSFMQNLMTTLHAQGGGNPGSGDGGTQAVAGDGMRAGGPGRLESDLQSLMQKLSASAGTSDTGSTNATNTDSGADTTGGSDSSTSSLQQSFANLMSALGENGGGASLGSFLQALQSHLSGVQPTGNAIDTTA